MRCSVCQLSRCAYTHEKATMNVTFDAGSRLYCRTCVGVVPHDPAPPEHVRCTNCGRPMLMAEVVTVYATDDYVDPGVLYLPLDLRPEWVRRRLANPRPPSAVVRGIDRGSHIR